MVTANELLQDALIRRQIYLSRFAAGMVREIESLLDSTEADVRSQLEARLEDVVERGFDTGPRTTSRLRVLEKTLGTIRQRAFDKAAEIWTRDLGELAASEVTYLDEALKHYAPVTVDTVLPTAATLSQLVATKPFQGEVMKEWAAKMARNDLERMMQQIRVGLVQGEPTREIARRIVGTAQLAGVDGTTQITRQNAQAISRTAVNHVANEAKQEYYKANSDLFSQEKFVATLDSRTTPVCRARDGTVWPIGEGPIPPLHWNCRSVRVPVLNGEELIKRPAVAASESALKGLTQKERSAKIRELTGRVPASTTYQQFLERQTHAFQDDVMGKTRARLFRDGHLTLDKFVDRKGHEYTLEQLRKREPEAFRRAGLFS